MKEQAAAGAILAALGGLKVGGLAGAVCGAVIGAVGVATAKMIDVAQCADVCKSEAATEHDPDAKNCEALLK
jgi:uncharacterized membrane protein